ncbi:MAG TPA: enoyl-CoA hydratase family protein [Azospirillum sp.]|nr:enoyl-CoA hydratase family protein [Azospirillum sp.]
MAGRIDVERKGHVLVLTMNDPPSRNALGAEMMDKAREAFDQAIHDPGIGAVVLTGAGGAFSSGGHLSRLYNHRTQSRSQNRNGIERFHGWVRAMRDCPKPVISAVEGPAAGAGFALALASDLIIAAEDAVFVTAYAKVGLTADGGISGSFARALPPQLAAELMFEGASVDPQRLYALGVVNRVVPKGRALDEAVAWAARLSEGPSVAIGRAKRLIESAYGSLGSQLGRESDQFVEALHHPEAHEAITAFFEKRPPVFHKR